MSETFSILIDSRSRFETGQPGGVWLSMPTTTEQLHEAMKSVGITADNPQDFFINGFANTEEYPFDVPLPVIQRSTIDELNYLGKLMEMQSDDDRDKFTAAGINQTKHQILLDVDVRVSILLPGITTYTKVSNEISVAETVIVGGVPQTYTYFSTTEDKIEDYADEYIMNNG